LPIGRFLKSTSFGGNRVIFGRYPTTEFLMIENDALRFYLLIATSVTFLGFALWSAALPTSLASILGYDLKSDNAHSEFHAIYVGVFLGQFLLCLLAASRVDDSVLGDLCGTFLLLQPLGRMIAILRGHRTTGILTLLFLAELVGGIALIAVRPS
jgi:hypothetical protein